MPEIVAENSEWGGVVQFKRSKNTETLNDKGPAWENECQIENMQCV